MSASTKRLRAAVFARAKELCECGCGRYVNAEEGRLDHFFGRAKAKESESNCWALTVFCDERKTRNEPSAAYWLKKFIAHADKYFFAAESERAFGKLVALQAKGRAA